jgi:signal transduction histidine kinase
VVDRNADRLLRLVGDLLFVAGADAGKLVLDLGEVDLAELASECLEGVRPLTEHRRIETSLEATGASIVGGDGARLAQLLDNLVSNAVKFTPDGGAVTLRITGGSDSIRLVVEDTGIGMRADEVERLFERFFRTQAATEAAIKGTGLGLSISKAIVEAHSGTIRAESIEGAGTAIIVDLPQHRPDRPGAPELLARQTA